MALTRETTGILLTLAGVGLISPDGLLVRLIATDPMTANFWRGALVGISLSTWLVVERRSRLIPGIDRWDVIFALMFALSGLAFIGAIAMTTIANVMVMTSAAPLSAAIAGAILLKQRISWRTWLSLAASAIGIWIVASGQETVTPGPIALERHLAGIGLALVSAVFIGIGVVARGKSRDDDSRPATILGAIIAALVAAPFADPLSLDAEQAMWMSLLGLIILPCAFVLLFLGPRYIHASRVTLIALLEAVLAPIWAWIFLGEEPHKYTITGGAIILCAIAFSAMETQQGQSQQ
jgi:drug/metabolite transporter (DMT)-like permease